MKSECITFDCELLHELAETYFLKKCRVNTDLNAKESQINEIYQKIREDIKLKLKVKVLISSYEFDRKKTNEIVIQGMTFPCDALKQLNQNEIHGIYAYMLTLGEFNIEYENLIEQFYADTLANSYLDATRARLCSLLKEKAKEDFLISSKKIAISDSFGPGYYGMDASFTTYFFQLFDANSVGIKLLNNGMMTPEKTNVGFFLVIDKNAILPHSACRYCIGNQGGCDLCIYSKNEDNKFVEKNTFMIEKNIFSKKNFSKNDVTVNVEKDRIAYMDKEEKKEQTHKITFLPNKIEVFAKESESIFDIAIKAGIGIEGICNHSGICGKCKIKITIGKTTEAEEAEKLVLTQEEQKKGYRLACRVYPRSDVRVFINEIDKNDTRKAEFITLPKWFQLDKIERMKQNSYGIAFDIGTTSIVGILWSLDGECIDVLATNNPQRTYGADVISRITFCMDNLQHTKLMQRIVIDCCNNLMKELCKRNERNVSDMNKIMVVGNTTMTHLFLATAIEGLAKSPFTPAFEGTIVRNAKSLGFDTNQNVDCRLLPNIAGHVGSDITAGIIATDLRNRIGIHILVDIGTNGEIVLKSKDRLYACSTAAGPAFEGAGIKHGMRASQGAIERVSIKHGDLSVKTIGDKKAIGICGSGLIDAIAELLSVGLIDETGRILDLANAKENNIPEGLLSRIQMENDRVSFVLVFGEKSTEDIVITQDDIRQVQLAKGAICAGINTLMHIANVEWEQVHEILLAGTFGNYIDKKSAVRIGLFHKRGKKDWDPILQEKIGSVGNTAGIGASMALLSTEVITNAEELVKQVEFVDLAKQEFFKTNYIESMNFPKQDR